LIVLLGNRTIEKSIPAVKCPDKLFESICALLQGLLGGRKFESLVSIGIRAENAGIHHPPSVAVQLQRVEKGGALHRKKQG
jgi:hypothetical protein